jgi:tetratricopeptide (TPR) repeat protein
MKKILIIVVLILNYTCFSQSKNTDSLSKVIHSSTSDTNKVKAFLSLSYALFFQNQDTGIVLVNSAINLSEKNHWQKGMALSYYTLGNYYRMLNEYFFAIKFYEKSIIVWQSLLSNNKESKYIKIRKSAAHTNLAIAYRQQSNYPKSLLHNLEALKLDEELNDLGGVATDYGNIGNIYQNLNQLEKALQYHSKALKIDESLDNKVGIARHYGNIANVYTLQQDTAKALFYYKKALAMEEAEKNLAGISRQLSNMSTIYNSAGNYAKSLELNFKALKIENELGNKSQIANINGNLGALFTHLNKFNEAESYLKKGLSISNEIGAIDFSRDFQKNLSDLYLKINKPALSLEYYKKYIVSRDSLMNNENTRKTVQLEMNYNFEKKEHETKLAQEKKDIIANEEIKAKTNQRNYFMFGFSVLIILIVFIFRLYKQTRKANSIISQQKKEVELHKTIIEEKQKEVLDSIHYAKRIQNALLPTEAYIERNLNKLKKRNN